MSAGRLLALMAVFAPLSLLSFGGGQSTIPEMQRQTVALHGWLTDAQFADIYAISRAAPGSFSTSFSMNGMPFFFRYLAASWHAPHHSAP